MGVLEGTAIAARPAEYHPEQGALMWKIKSLPGGREALLRVKFGLPTVSGEEVAESKRPIQTAQEAFGQGNTRNQTHCCKDHRSSLRSCDHGSQIAPSLPALLSERSGVRRGWLMSSGGVPPRRRYGTVPFQ